MLRKLGLKFLYSSNHVVLGCGVGTRNHNFNCLVPLLDDQWFQRSLSLLLLLLQTLVSFSPSLTLSRHPWCMKSETVVQARHLRKNHEQVNAQINYLERSLDSLPAFATALCCSLTPSVGSSHSRLLSDSNCHTKKHQLLPKNTQKSTIISEQPSQHLTLLVSLLPTSSSFPEAGQLSVFPSFHPAQS